MVICHHPPVAAGGEGAGVVLDGHGFFGKLAWCERGPVVLVFVDIAVFVGDANAADGVGGVVLDFDKGSAFGETEGEGEETEGKEKLGDL